MEHPSFFYFLILPAAGSSTGSRLAGDRHGLAGLAGPLGVFDNADDPPPTIIRTRLFGGQMPGSCWSC